MHLRPDPDFEEFALDCIRLSNEEKSPTLRRKLLTLAREWMHAAMHQQGAEIHRESTERTDANSGEPWSEMDISDLTNEIAHDRTMAEIASFVCRDEDEVRQKARELGMVDGSRKEKPLGKRGAAEG
jgi:hypothetical protein